MSLLALKFLLEVTNLTHTEIWKTHKEQQVPSCGQDSYY